MLPNSLKLTNSSVTELAGRNSRYIVWDTALKGFGCRVEVSGTKTFLVRYRAAGGGRKAPKRYFTIGRFPTLSADDARREARKILADAIRGADPAGDRNAARQDLTVAELCDLYMREAPHLPTRFGVPKSPETLRFDQGRIESHIKPLLGKRRVGDVTTADIQRFMRDIAKGRTARDQKAGHRKRIIVRGGKGAATRVTGLLSGIFTFAVMERLRPDNPVRGVRRYADGKSERALQPTELRALGKSLDVYEQSGGNPAAVAIIRLLIFTGARRSEITGLRWEEVDFTRDVIRLPAIRHKTGAATGTKEIVLTPPAKDILTALHHSQAAGFVFPAQFGKSHFQGLKQPWESIRAAAGLDDVRLHDLRHSFASVGISGGDSLPIIGALLGHSNPKTTQRYAHVAKNPVRAAADRIAQNILASMRPSSPAEQSE